MLSHLPNPKPISPNRNGPSLLRLAVSLILRGQFGSLVTLLAIVCSSWSAVNLGTSERDELVPLGATYKPSVRSANKMVSRTGVC